MEIRIAVWPEKYSHILLGIKFQIGVGLGDELASVAKEISFTLCTQPGITPCFSPFFITIIPQEG
jgi:hypothetical protein